MVSVCSPESNHCDMASKIIRGNCPQLLKKFRGCMLGSLVGDCLGSPFEGEVKAVSKTVLNKYFQNLHNTNVKVPYKAYTDDTAMTFSVAQSLISNKGFNARNMAQKFVDEYYAQPRRGYGANIIDVFAALKFEECEDPYGPARLQFAGRGSYGNGAAMRIAPVALFCQSSESEAINLAHKQSLITHTNELGYNGAILQCLAIHKALHSDPEKPFDVDQFAEDLQIKMAAIEESKQENNLLGSLQRTKPNSVKDSYVRKLAIVRKLLKNSSVSSEYVADVLGNLVTAYGSVPTAIYSFLRAVDDDKKNPKDNPLYLPDESPFQRTIRYAISVGGDTDTIASMAGSIAGAFYGQAAIQPTLLQQCEDVETSLELADKLYEVAEK